MLDPLWQNFLDPRMRSHLIDPTKLSDPAEDYTQSLIQHFPIYPTACVRKLHVKGILAQTILAASVTNILLEFCSDINKGCQNLLQWVHVGYGPSYNTLVKVIQ